MGTKLKEACNVAIRLYDKEAVSVTVEVNLGNYSKLSAEEIVDLIEEPLANAVYLSYLKNHEGLH